MPERLTDKLAKTLEPAAGRLDRIVYDTEVKGFGLRITKAGARSFVVNYRVAGRERRYTIGAYPDWSVVAAREETRHIKRLIDQGQDPLDERNGERHAPTVANLAKRYLEEHAIRKVPLSRKDDQAMLEKLVLPRIGRMKVTDVRRADIDRLHREISKHTPIRANRVAQMLSKMFSLAIRWEYRNDNPVQGLQKNREEPRHRYLSTEELERLVRALAAHRNQRCADVIRLLLLTGARRGEAMSATWDQFDLERGVWTKPSAHTKQKREHRVPLSVAAVQLLKEIRASAVGGSRFIFPGDRPGQPLTEIRGFWLGVRRKAQLGDLRIHDLRHTYASILASSGLSLPVIGALLGHTQPQSTARYSHLFDDPLRKATETVGSVLSALNRQERGSESSATAGS